MTDLMTTGPAVARPASPAAPSPPASPEVLAEDVVTITGEVDLATAGTWQACLRRAARQGKGSVVADVSGVTFIDCAGLQVLRDAEAQLRAAGRVLQLRTPSDAVLRLLRGTNLTGHFATAPVVTEPIGNTLEPARANRRNLSRP